MRLYRYISFEEFMSLLTTNQLHYVNPTKWQDVYEGAMFKALESPSLRKELLNDLITESSQNGAENALKNYCKLLFAKYHWFGQCWTYESDESDAFWRIYSYDNHAVRISTTSAQIDSLFPSSLYYKESKKVKYDCGPDEKIIKKMLDKTLQVKSTNECYFHKRKAFQHEKEYRFLVSPKCGEDRLVLNFQFRAIQSHLREQLKSTPVQPTRKKEWISLADQAILAAKIHNSDIGDYSVAFSSPNAIINSVLVHPFAPKWYVELIQKICINNDLKFSGQSKLYSADFT